MNVLRRRRVGVHGELREVGRLLVIELDENHGTLDAVVEDAVRL
jgi:hypothetical protein